MMRRDVRSGQNCARTSRGVSNRRREKHSAKTRFHLERLEPRLALAFGLTTTTNLYTVDTGAGLVFSVQRTHPQGSVGDLTSVTLNGTQLEAPFATSSRYSHYESGLGSSTIVTATVDPSGQWILITCDDTSGTGVIQYYLGRKGFNNVYMATYSAGPDSPSPGEMRFIDYTNPTLLTNIPAPSNNNGSTGAIESSDVFGFANGQTSSKYYGEYSAIDTQTYGDSGISSGTLYGLWMNIGNRETSSGGPFYKDIDFQNNELYTYTFSGHSQTEAFRPGLKGFYALMATTTTDTTDPAMPPPAPDYSFIDTLGVGSHIAGYVGASGRGTLSGTASGVPSGLQATVALSNAADQYWATPNPATGAYTISGVLPGKYTETIYQGELEVGTQSVTISAGATTTANIAKTLVNPTEVFLIGTWDGTPDGFLNADLIGDMHPSDVRMNPWGTFIDSTDTTAKTTYIVGTSTANDWPMAEWKEATTDPTKPIDNINEIQFTLTAAQVVNSTLRIGLTRDSSSRPIINVNGGSFSSAPGLTNQPSSRGITTGNWRGNNATYDYSISASSLHVGVNTIDIEVASGSSSGSPWLGPSIDYDAIDLVATSSLTNASKATTVVLTPSNPGLIPLGGEQTFTAIVKDQFGNPMPLALGAISWSLSTGTPGSVSSSGVYVAGTTAGSGTLTASYFDSANNKTVSATANIIADNAPTVATAAAANPSPVTGISTALSVLGADDSGEATLNYTWSTTGTPPAGVNFSANGANAAKNVTATFSRAGTYNFQVRIVDAQGLSVTSSVNVTVNQTLASINISPSSATIFNNNTQQFTAVGLDQFGNLLSVQPNFAWTTDSGSIGSVDQSGLYTAPTSSIGSATVRAASGAISGAATVNVAWLKGDLNGNGQLGSSDISALMLALSNLSAYQAQRGLNGADLMTIADVNNDGFIDNRDIQSLIILLANSPGLGAGGGSSGSASGSDDAISGNPNAVPTTAAAAVDNTVQTTFQGVVAAAPAINVALDEPIVSAVALMESSKIAPASARQIDSNLAAIDRYYLDISHDARLAIGRIATRARLRHLFSDDAAIDETLLSE